jgi:ATP-dependent helicase/nuclease subunit A
VQEKTKELNFDDPSQLQAQASDPSANVYVSASAGTGKTKILVDRFLRLILNGTKPEAILALTFTNAAALEMLERIEGRLKKWHCVDTDELVADLTYLTGHAPEETAIRRARQAFTHFIDNFDELKIMTLHAFCNKVLLRYQDFNFGNFSIIDTNHKREILERVYYQIIAQTDHDLYLQENLQFLLETWEYECLKDLIEKAITEKIRLERFLHSKDNIMDLFKEIEHDFSSREELDLTHALPELNHLNKLIQLLQVSDEKKLADKFHNWLRGSYANEWRRVLAYCDVYMTSQHTPSSRLVKKKFKDEYADWWQFITEQQQAACELQQRISNWHSTRVNKAFLFLVLKVYQEYTTHKEKHNMVEYDDLIIRTIELLQESEQAYEALYKIDMSIDHIMIDEAQDTNALQWEIIKLISEEFYSGIGAKEENRTVFIVGDFKQSIYSFQGAQPDIFHNIKKYFATCCKQANKVWREIHMETSFRSTKNILSGVNAIFSDQRFQAALGHSGKFYKHKAFRNGDGCIVCWPLLPQDKLTDQENTETWAFPESNSDNQESKYLLAVDIAERINSWIQTKRLLKGRSEPVKAGDILVLVRKRSQVMQYLEAELKACGIDVITTQKTDMKEELVVLDLLAMLHFVLLPDDDYNLACLLKSPIFNCDEQRLHHLCQRRLQQQCTLLQVIANEAEDIYLKLEAMRKDQGSILEFYYKYLFSENIISFFKSRFGEHVDEIINSFLQAVQHYEADTSQGDIQGFLAHMRKNNIPLSTGEQNQGAVRIMTVHAAKGLQAPIVIVADSSNSEQTPVQMVYWQKGYKLRISSGSRFATEHMNAVKEEKAAEEYAESLRLLYVAMTRAEDELYFTGWENRKQNGSWYEIAHEFTQGDENYLESNASIELSKAELVKPTNITKLPAFLQNILKADKTGDINRNAEPRVETDTTIFEISTPSESGHQLQAATARGHEIHQHLFALSYYSGEVDDYLDEYVENPKMEELLRDLIAKHGELIVGENGISEAPIAYKSGNKIVMGQIDRLVIEPGLITIIDYKTDQISAAAAENIPEQYRKQLNSYRDAIALAYPSSTITTYILWVEHAKLVKL